MEAERCPKCKSDSEVTRYWSVTPGFHSGAEALVLIGGVTILGRLLALSIQEAALFLLAGLLPFVLKVHAKCTCERCAIDFARTEGKPQRS